MSPNKPATDEDVLNRLGEILGDAYHPLLCKARNAVALQKVADDQIRRTVKGNVIIRSERQRMVTYVSNANQALEALIKYVMKEKGDLVGDLLKVLRESGVTPGGGGE